MEIIFLIAALAAFLWAIIFLRYAGLWGAVVAVLPIGTILGYEFFNTADVITLDRLLLCACVALAAIGRWWGVWRGKPWNTSDFLMACFFGVILLGTVTTDFRANNNAGLARLLFFYFLPSFMYILARQLEITPNRLIGMYAVMATLGLYLSFTSVAEKYSLDWAIYPKYIITSQNQEFLGRGRGPLLNPSANGVLLTLGLSCWLMFFGYFARFGKLLVTSVIPIFLAGIYCTMTRCVWMGGAAALGGITLITMPKRMRMPLFACMLIGGILVVGLNYEKLQSFKRDKNVSEAGMRESAELRPILAYVAWQMFLDHPIAGVGTGQYKSQAKYYLQDRSVDLPLEKVRPYVQHNIFLSLLTENGLLGLLPFLGLLCIWSRDAWSLWNRKAAPLPTRQMGLVFLGMLAGFIANGMFQDVLIMQMMNAYFFFLGGCVRNLAAEKIVVYEPWRGSQKLVTAAFQNNEARNGAAASLS